MPAEHLLSQIIPVATYYQNGLSETILRTREALGKGAEWGPAGVAER